MKERINKIVLALLVFGGLVLVVALIKSYLPELAYYTFAGLVFLWLLYDCSKSEKKTKETYWYYTYFEQKDGGISLGCGVQHSKASYFDLYYHSLNN